MKSSRSRVVEHVVGECLDARRVAQVEAEDLETIAPVGEVGLGGVASRSVAGKAGDDDQRRAAAQQLDACLVADLHAAAGEQGHRAGQVGEFGPLREVELGAARTELVVEVVDLAVVRLADVAVLFVHGLSVRRFVDVVLHEVRRRYRVGSREHRLVAKRADPCAGEHAFVTLHPSGAALPLQRLRAEPTYFRVGAEDVTGGVEQRHLLLRGEERKELRRRCDLAEQLGGVEQALTKLLICDRFRGATGGLRRSGHERPGYAPPSAAPPDGPDVSVSTGTWACRPRGG